MILSPFPNDFSITCVVPEPINDYLGHEWALVYLTFLLFAATFGLMIFTWRLWKATIKLAQDAERASREQHDTTVKALAAAERSSGAAEKSANVSERALIVAQRAFVFFQGFSTGYDQQRHGFAGYIIFCEFENSGQTPATDVRVSVKFQVVQKPLGSIPLFTTDQSKDPSSVMGPRSAATSSWQKIDVKDLVECWKGKCEIYAWARVEYRDVFNPDTLHHHEQCVRLTFIHDPSTVPAKGHPPYVQYMVDGPQNSTS